MEANQLKERTELVLRTLQKHFKNLQSYEGVVAMGAGFMTDDGQLTETIGIYLEVEDETALESLKKEGKIPETLENIPIELQVTPEKEVHVKRVKKEEAELAESYRPLKGGAQITNDIVDSEGYISIGTLGCMAYFPQKKKKNDYIGIISNYHVMFAKGAGEGHPIYQPNDMLSAVGNIVQGQKVGSEVDWAVAKLADGVTASNEVLGIGEIRAFSDAYVGERVRKYGNTTQHTVGNIIKVGFWQDPEPPYTVVYTGLTIVDIDYSKKFSDHGDSGAVILNENFDIVGLLWGGSVNKYPKETYANDQRKLHFNEGKFEVPIPKEKQVQHLFSDLPRLMEYQERMQQTEYGRTLLELFLKHIPEVTDLHNHNRAAKVAWQRNHGPLFIRFIREKENEEEAYVIPKKVGGIQFSEMFQNMRKVYETEGSKELNDSFQKYGDQVLKLINDSSTVEAFLQQVVSSEPKD